MGLLSSLQERAQEAHELALCTFVELFKPASHRITRHGASQHLPAGRREGAVSDSPVIGIGSLGDQAFSLEREQRL